MQPRPDLAVAVVMHRLALGKLHSLGVLLLALLLALLLCYARVSIPASSPSGPAPVSLCATRCSEWSKGHPPARLAFGVQAGSEAQGPESELASETCALNESVPFINASVVQGGLPLVRTFSFAGILPMYRRRLDGLCSRLSRWARTISGFPTSVPPAPCSAGLVERGL